MKSVHITLIIALLSLIVLVPEVKGQKKNVRQLVEIEIIPDHDTWTYDVGEEAVFSIRVVRANVALTDVRLSYSIGAEKMPPVMSGDTIMTQSVLTLSAGTMSRPGFMTCSCNVEVEGHSYSNYVNIAFAPHSIMPTQIMPHDFNLFWQKSLEKAALIPIDPVVTLVPEKCTACTNVYHVQLQHWRKDTYLYGWLCVPKKQGKYPAVLCLPGAGVKPVPAEVQLSEVGEGMITFAIGVNGIPLNLSQEVYDNLRYGVLKDYAFIHLDDKAHYYYRRIYTGCVRAIDYISTLEEYDGRNLGVIGGSQGGALSIVTASLDSRVKALVAFYPALCDVTGYLHGRAGGWPHMFADKNNQLNNKTDKIITTQYYDVVNFARQLQVPGYYSWGYNDPTCPPTSYYAAYNVIEAPKSLFVAHQAGHWRFPEQTEVAWAWLYDMLTQCK